MLGAAIETADRATRKPFPWLGLAFVVGAALRLGFVFGTEGTVDVALWEEHARGVASHGLRGWYATSPMVNHPPPALLAVAGLHALAQALGVPFRIALRLPFALLDLVTGGLLLRLFREHPLRRWLAAGYALHPLAIVLSGYHGNTDSGVAFLLVVAVLLLQRHRVGALGAVVGLGVWLKLPTVLAVPALYFSLRNTRERLRFVSAAAVVAFVGYAPALLLSPGLVVARVFGYGGIPIRTESGEWIWGLQTFYRWLDVLPQAWWPALAAGIDGYYRLNSVVCLTLVLLFALLDRSQDLGTARIGRSIAASYLILYGFTNFFGFQYFAWSIPFWFAVGPRYALASGLLLGAYIYGVNAWACADPLLRGSWELITRPAWPFWLAGLRDASVAFCAISGVGFLVGAWGRWRAQRGASPSGGAASST